MNQYSPFNGRTSSLADLELHELGIVSFLKAWIADCLCLIHAWGSNISWYGFSKKSAQLLIPSKKSSRLLRFLGLFNKQTQIHGTESTKHAQNVALLSPRAHKHTLTHFSELQEIKNQESSVEKIFHVPCGILLNYFYCVFGRRLITAVVWRTSTIVDDDATVDRRNPAPAEYINITLFSRFYTSRMMQDFFNQQYPWCCSCSFSCSSFSCWRLIDHTWLHTTIIAIQTTRSRVTSSKTKAFIAKALLGG